MSADSSFQNAGAADPVRTYLADLERALAGADAALIHDALVDAETHLRETIAGGTDPTAAVLHFGQAQDIADAYLDVAAGVRRYVCPKGAAAGANDAMPANPPAPPKHRLRDMPMIGIWFDPHAWGSLAFLTFGFVFALVVFLWLLGLSLFAVSTVPFLIGLPLLVLVLGSSRGLSLVLGKIIECLIGVRMPRRAHVVDVSGAKGVFRRIWCWIKDGRSWMTVAFFAGNLPVALLCFACFWTVLDVGVGWINRAAFNPPCIAMNPTDGRLRYSVTTDFMTAKDEGSFFTLSMREFDMPKPRPDGQGIPERDLHPKQVLVAPPALTDASSGETRLSLVGRLLFLAAGVLWLTAVLWLAKGAAWVYAQVVKAIQVARPVAWKA